MILLSAYLLIDLVLNNIFFFQNAHHFVNKIIPFRDKLLVILGFIFLLIAIISFQISLRPFIAIVLLMTTCFFFTFYAIMIFDFLNLWDEQYHALVAKNMIGHPFKPMLYVDPLLRYDYKNWTANHVWLHKQPLFLWQIALSIKIFGAKVWAIRIPDLVMTVLLVPVIYRMGQILVDNRTGFWAGVFFTVSNFLFGLVSGGVATDHNDVAFLFYVTLSIWAWLEYEQREANEGQLKFAILSGIFAGAAILVKWLPGMLVYSAWILSIILSGISLQKFKSYLHILIGLLATTLVALPWQLYILLKFPLESRYEFKLSSSHFITIIESHGGDGSGWHYYLNNFRDVFSIYYITIILLAFVFITIAKKRKLAVCLILMLVIVFIFYSASATKMPAYVFMVLPIILLVYASLYTLIEKVISQIVPFRLFQIVLMSALVLNIAAAHYHLKFKYSGAYATMGTESCNGQRSKMACLYRSLAATIPESQKSRYVIIHCPWEEIPHIMFYTGIKAAYDQISNNDLTILKSHKEIRIAYLVFSDVPIPKNLQKDDAIQKIRLPISTQDFGHCFH